MSETRFLNGAQPCSVLSFGWGDLPGPKRLSTKSFGIEHMDSVIVLDVMTDQWIDADLARFDDQPQTVSAGASHVAT